MKALRSIGALAFVAGLFTCIFAGLPWYVVVADDPDDRKGALQSIDGSQSDHWNKPLADQAVQALWLKNSDAETRDIQLGATVAALTGISPKGAISGQPAN